MNIDQMNETDVREVIVRPFIQRLGYEHGTSNNVRTEVQLTYKQRVLGHKKPDRDHPMRGRADYVCDVTSYGRWTVEVKAPNIELKEEDWVQAHSYAAHPEIAATYFLITNGRIFRVYSMVEPKSPILEWTSDTIDEAWINIYNVLAPERIRARCERDKSHRHKALALGITSTAEIVGGMIEYGRYETSDPQFENSLQSFEGLRATVESGKIERLDSGMIRGRLRLNGPTAIWDQINAIAGLSGYEFETADEYISTDAEHPTIFQGLSQFEMPPGTSLKGVPGMPPGIDCLPIGFRVSAFTQATGFFADGKLQGIFSIEYGVTPALKGARSLPSVISTGRFSLNIV